MVRLSPIAVAVHGRACDSSGSDLTSPPRRYVNAATDMKRRVARAVHAAETKEMTVVRPPRPAGPTQPAARSADAAE